MDGIIHVILLLSGLCSLSSCGLLSPYIYHTSAVIWQQAQRYCRQKCYDLVTIDDMEEMEMVLNTVGDQYSDTVWIGLWKGGTGRWHWSLADKDFYKEGERSYLIWGVVPDINNCGLYKNGKLYSYLCETLLNSVCFDGRKQGRDQYILNNRTMSWVVARDHCRSHYTDLTSLRNDAEYQTIQEVAGDLKVWVGLFRDSWGWSDQSDSSYRYWKPDKKVFTTHVNTCGALLKSHSGRWGERWCREIHKFVCKCPIVSFIKVKISSQQNDPAVQDAILKQIEKELKKRNVMGGYKLQWRKHPDGRVFIKEP